MTSETTALYVVSSVAIVTWVALFFYLMRMDRKVSQLEKDVHASTAIRKASKEGPRS